MASKLLCMSPIASRLTFFNQKNFIFTRQFYRWLIIMFNGVNEKRIKEVGPERACAEWLLRNGASIKRLNSSTYLDNYNSLPSENEKFHIQAVDATDSAIHHIGFNHFHGCKHIEEVKLVNCSYIENGALPLLSIIKDSLKYFELIECKNITDEALLEIKNLVNLKTLKMGGMPYVKDKSRIVSELTAALPNCKITYD